MFDQNPEQLNRILRPLMDAFSYRIDVLEPWRMILTNGKVALSFLAVPHDWQVAVSVIDLVFQPGREYSPFYLLAIRAPDVLAARASGKDNGETNGVTGDGLVSAASDRSIVDCMWSQMSRTVNDLIKWSPDILSGDFDRIVFHDHYFEWKQEVERLKLGPLQKLAFDDPIRVKSRKLDFSWVQDLKRRLQAGTR